jgi:hypothetical protein
MVIYVLQSGLWLGQRVAIIRGIQEPGVTQKGIGFTDIGAYRSLYVKRVNTMEIPKRSLCTPAVMRAVHFALRAENEQFAIYGLVDDGKLERLGAGGIRA